MIIIIYFNSLASSQTTPKWICIFALFSVIFSMNRNFVLEDLKMYHIL